MRTARLISLFEREIISDRETANAWIYDVLGRWEMDLDGYLQNLRTLPEPIQMRVIEFFGRIRNNNFRWRPFVIGGPGGEIILNAEQCTLCEAVLTAGNTKTP